MLQTLDLRSNQIAVIEGISRNKMLRKLLVDDNCVLQITGVAGLPLQVCAGLLPRSLHPCGVCVVRGMGA